MLGVLFIFRQISKRNALLRILWLEGAFCIQENVIPISSKAGKKCLCSCDVIVHMTGHTLQLK